jgi:hypothetical protein
MEPGFSARAAKVMPCTTNLIWSLTVPSAAKNSNTVPNAVRVFSAINVMGSYPGKRLHGRHKEQDEIAEFSSEDMCT